MKNLILTFLFSIAITGAFAQTTLPTSFSDFSAALPTGWTYLNNNGGAATYAVGSDATPACRLDGTGEYLEIYFSDVPGTLSYYAKGTGISAPYFTGQFTIQESVNGTTWSDIHNYTTALPLTGAFVQYSHAIASTSRYVRFYYTEKISGTNVALDQVSLTKATLPIDINIKQATTSISNGSTFSIGNSTTTTFTVENLGTSGTLNISSSPVTGTDASMFGITGMPASVASSGSATFDLTFTPSGPDGSKHAIITINSNDPNDPAYVINIYAIKGSVATEPAAQPTGITFSNVKSYTFDVAYTAASPAVDKYIVLIKRGSAFSTEEPVDATTYHVGDYIGGAQVVYIGTGTSLTPNFIVANTNYYIRVFSFNGPNGFENYLQAGPLSGSTASSNGNIGATYTGVSSANATLVAQLHAVVYPHTQIYYSNYAPVLIDLFESRDTTNGQKVVTCPYTGYNYIYSGVFSWTPSGDLTREHSYCYSWMPAAITQDSVPYSDLHNLYPVEFTNANSKRSNYPLGDVVNVTFSWMGGQLGTNASGQTVYEPRDADKGDAARAIMYMCICYTGIGGVWALPATQDQDVLKQWHSQDPPDNWEIARNDFIDWKQGNRNPFIDSVDYACHINFSNMTYIANPGPSCSSSGISKTNTTTNINIYPNPANQNVAIDFGFDKNQQAVLQITDYTGKLVQEINISIVAGQNHLDISTSELPEGVYMLNLKSQEINFCQKVVVLR